MLRVYSTYCLYHIMANIITISDSDSDDLPSFAERVQKLIAKEGKGIKSPKQKSSQIHSISDSDSDDSRKTIPLTRARSVSPVFSLPISPKYDSYLKSNSLISDNDTLDLNHRTPSPVLGLPDLENRTTSPVHSVPDLDRITPSPVLSLPDLDHRTPSPVLSLPDVNNSESPPWSLPDLPHCSSSQKYVNLSSDDDICVKKLKNDPPKVKRNNKEIEKEQKKKIRLEKQKEKDLMKALKETEKEILKNQKPGECWKDMKVVVDCKIMSLEGNQDFLESLSQNGLNYSVEDSNCKYSVTWYRKVINISTENHEIIREEREELADILLLVIPNEDFLKMVHAYIQNSKGRHCDNLSLEEFIASVKSLYPDCGITCVTIGFEKYMRNIKENGSVEVKSIVKQVHKNASEEAVIQLQLQSCISFNFLDTMSNFSSLIPQFTKAIAEAPRRKEKENHKSMAFSWYADIDSHCPIKLSKDRSSFIKLWRQQIQQFQNVGPEVADAIVSHYSSPQSLLKAYKRCSTTKDAENLLQDIVVRRNYGPLGTQKRIGPELSFKIYLFFTSWDGNKLLKR